MTRWPAMMRKATAAEYLDLSVASFEREIVAGNLPAPIALGGKDHWSRDALDMAIAMMTGHKPEYLSDFEKRYGPKAA